LGYNPKSKWHLGPSARGGSNMSLIEINIKNFFNKKDDHLKNEDKFLNNSTMSGYKDIRETSSVAISSLTNS